MSYKQLALDRCEILHDALVASDLKDDEKRMMLHDLACIVDCIKRTAK